MHVPVWLTLAVAVVVIVFGGYRIWLATRPRDVKAEASKRGGALGSGFYRMSPRTHVLVGVVYLLLGGSLIATSFGWTPFGDSIGPNTAKPSKDNAPTTTGVPIDQVPAPKK